MIIETRICEMLGLPAYTLTWYTVFKWTIRYVSAILAGLAVIAIVIFGFFVIIGAIVEIGRRKRINEEIKKDKERFIVTQKTLGGENSQ